VISHSVNTETSETEGSRRAGGVSDVSSQKKAVPDSEVKVPVRCPRYIENFKQEVLKHVCELRGGYRNTTNFIHMIYFVAGKLKYDYPL